METARHAHHVRLRARATHAIIDIMLCLSAGAILAQNFAWYLPSNARAAGLDVPGVSLSGSRMPDMRSTMATKTMAAAVL